MPLYYAFKKSDGTYAGSGTRAIDDDVHGCTEIQAPPVQESELYWNGSQWLRRNSDPNIISPRQVRLALLAQGVDLSELEASLPNDTARVEWEYATEINRHHPLVAALAAQLGYSESDVDALFAAARSL